MKQYTTEFVSVESGEEHTKGGQSIGQVVDLVHKLQPGDALVINRTEDRDTHVSGIVPGIWTRDLGSGG